MGTDEYTAGLDDVRTAYVYENPAAAYDLELRAQRERAFDRLIRRIQDVAFEDGFEQAHWETEEF